MTVLGSAFAGLEQANVRWALLRGVDTDGDVDLLVERSDRRRLETALRRQGFVHVPAAGHASHRFFVAYDSGGDRWHRLDVVSELAFGPEFALRTYAESECLGRRRRGDVAVLDPSDELWALLLHCMLDKREFAEKHRRRLGALVASGAGTDSPLARAVDRLAADDARSADLLENVRAGDWNALVAAGRDLEAGWLRHQPSARARRLRNRVARGLRRMLDPPRRKGFAVALLAPDGAGKTTLAHALSKTFFLPVSVVYMGLYQRSGRPARRHRVPGVFVIERLGLSWARATAGFAARAAGRLVVFDRYPCEALVTPAEEMNLLGRGHRVVLGHSCPHPDLTVVLDAPGSVLHARKPEHPATDLERMRRRVADLGQRLPRAVVVDATRGADEVRSEVTDLVWRAYCGVAPPLRG